MNGLAALLLNLLVWLLAIPATIATFVLWLFDETVCLRDGFEYLSEREK